jgi:hypothetical protein
MRTSVRWSTPTSGSSRSAGTAARTDRVSASIRPIAGLRFQPYAVYEIQRSYDHLFDSTATLGRRQQSEEFTRTLVGFDFEWELSNSSYINCTLERRVQDYQNQRNQEYNLFTISIKRFL